MYSERSEEKINNPRCEVILSGDYIIAGLLIYSNRNMYCNFTIPRTVTGKMLLTSRLHRDIMEKN